MRFFGTVAVAAATLATTITAAPQPPQAATSNDTEGFAKYHELALGLQRHNAMVPAAATDNTSSHLEPRAVCFTNIKFCQCIKPTCLCAVTGGTNMKNGGPCYGKTCGLVNIPHTEWQLRGAFSCAIDADFPGPGLGYESTPEYKAKEREYCKKYPYLCVRNK